MKLNTIQLLNGKIELLSGLHIGAGDTNMHIGGIDSPVIKSPVTGLPYIPGSSLKGKMRSLLELRTGAMLQTKGAPSSYRTLSAIEGGSRTELLSILQLFGCSGDDQLNESEAFEIGPTRLAFWDSNMCETWLSELAQQGKEYLPEEKSENSINRVTSVANHPRFIERVPAGTWFDFRLTVKMLDNDDQNLLKTLCEGLKLLELDGIGGSGSRGYGKIKFHDLTLNNEPIELDSLVL